MVLEYGDIDLARLLAKHEKARREDGAEDLDENFIRLYWQQMLQACSNSATASVLKRQLLCPYCSISPAKLHAWHVAELLQAIPGC